MNALGGMDEANNVKSRQEKHLLFPIPTLEVLTNKGITGNNPVGINNIKSDKL